ncbi:MAG: glycosyltransferase [Candidatus Eremiobacteraeota bacterium]|nr:glycosyltransferase [Candidatus Eremiobacteraeota bacterium]
MAKVLATVLITPREQFSKARASLESILARTDPAVPIVYIDGNSPTPLARHLKAESAKRGFTLIRTEHFLAANQARNIGLPHVRTKYVAFVDNDVSVEPGWLDKLIACAEETGAWAVGPLYLIDDPAKQIIHTAGADLRIVEEDGHRRLHEHHRFGHQPVATVRRQLVRQPIDLVEFHCMLVRRDVFDRLGPLDEQLISFFDHVDFCLDIADSGGVVYSEPAAVVTHLAPPPFAFSDLPCFLLRWSNAWMEPSIRRFAEKRRLSLSDEDFNVHRRYRDSHRMRLLGPTRAAVRRLTGSRGLAAADRFVTRIIFDRLIERTVVRTLEQDRRRSQSAAPALPVESV